VHQRHRKGVVDEVQGCEIVILASRSSFPFSASMSCRSTVWIQMWQSQVTRHLIELGPEFSPFNIALVRGGCSEGNAETEDGQENTVFNQGVPEVRIARDQGSPDCDKDEGHDHLWSYAARHTEEVGHLGVSLRVSLVGEELLRQYAGMTAGLRAGTLGGIWRSSAQGAREGRDRLMIDLQPCWLLLRGWFWRDIGSLNAHVVCGRHIRSGKSFQVDRVLHATIMRK